MATAYVARCRLTLHDNLFYASRELGRTYETEKYLHNYGLAYALGLVRSPYFNGLQVPRYEADLSAAAWYITPARPLKVSFNFATFKMATVPYYSFSPQITQNRVVYGRAKEIAPGSTFEFFVLGQAERKLPRWIRLGKWMAKAEVVYKWYKLNSQTADATKPILASCPLNPLDILPQRLFSYDIVPMPPVSLLTQVYFSGQYVTVPAEDLEGFRLNDKNEKTFIPVDISFFGGESK